jgi:hypothetical protein
LEKTKTRSQLRLFLEVGDAKGSTHVCKLTRPRRPSQRMPSCHGRNRGAGSSCTCRRSRSCSPPSCTRVSAVVCSSVSGPKAPRYLEGQLPRMTGQMSRSMRPLASLLCLSRHRWGHNSRLLQSISQAGSPFPDQTSSS